MDNSAASPVIGLIGGISFHLFGPTYQKRVASSSLFATTATRMSPIAASSYETTITGHTTKLVGKVRLSNSQKCEEKDLLHVAFHVAWNRRALLGTVENQGNSVAT
jgi:hypothetical protein